MNMKKRILVTASTFPVFGKDGEPRFVYDLAKGLLDRFDITVLAPASPGALLEEDMDGVRVVRYRYAPERSLETLTYPGAIVPRIREKPARVFLIPLLLWGLRRAVLRELKREKYDCIHAHWLIPQGMVHSWLPQSCPPFVVTGHGSDVFSLDSGVFRMIKRRVLDRAAAITVVSKALKEKLSSMIRDKEIYVMPMGCDIDRFSPLFAEADFFTRRGIDGAVILFVGRLAENKGIPFLFKALLEPPLSDTNAHVVIVGNGPQKKELERQVDSFGLRKRVTFWGAVSHDELPVIYASADVFCAPSITDEGFGLVLVEAEASGLPVVATAAAGTLDAVRHGETGILVERKNVDCLARALSGLLRDPALKSRMGKAGSEYARKYSWKRVSDAYAGLYESICN